jgi:hypothetical protein
VNGNFKGSLEAVLQDTEYREINTIDMNKTNDIIGSKATTSIKNISGAVSKCNLTRKYSNNESDNLGIELANQD